MTTDLAPPPHRLRLTDETLRLASAAILTADDPGHEPAAQRLEAGFAAAGVRARRADNGSRPEPGVAPVALLLDPSAMPPGPSDEREAYRLEVAGDGIAVIAADAAGLYHGAGTLLGWLATHAPAGPGPPADLPGVRIDDAPGFRHRGLLLDVSRNRVPTREFLFQLVDSMAALKLNQLQLYTEHTFAYRGHEIVWRDSSPLTAEDVRALDAHCRQRFVELVPNQNSFGHLHRWLRHQPYRRLAEVPAGMPHPFGDDPEPFSLCPVDPNAVELLRDLYDQLLPLFTSPLFNVGCDETFDLGKGRSAAACAERGTGRVYLEFLRRLAGLAAGHGRRIQFWGDILAGQPDLLGEVPTDAVVLEWGYEAGHPFDERAAALAAAGLEFYLCPGTSSWNSFAGRHDNALANLAEAARAGAAHGAAGYLITDWGDHGHLQPPPVSWPALVAGASFAWNPAAAAEPAALPVASMVDRVVGPGLAAGTGDALVALGNVYRETGVKPMNASALFKLVIFAGRSLADAGLGGLTSAGLDRAEAAIAGAADAVAALAAGNEGEGLVRRELSWVANMLRFACALGRARLASGAEHTSSLPAGERRGLARDLGRRIAEMDPLWLARSRPGGLDDSRRRLEGVQRLLAP